MKKIKKFAAIVAASVATLTVLTISASAVPAKAEPAQIRLPSGTVVSANGFVERYGYGDTSFSERISPDTTASSITSEGHGLGHIPSSQRQPVVVVRPEQDASLTVISARDSR